MVEARVVWVLDLCCEVEREKLRVNKWAIGEHRVVFINYYSLVLERIKHDGRRERVLYKRVVMGSSHHIRAPDVQRETRAGDSSY